MNKLNFKCYDSPFADRLRTLMEENNTKQNIIAELLGVTRQSVSQYCDGTSLPPIDKIITLANYYNVSTDYILGLSEHSTTNTKLKSVCEYVGLSEAAANMLSEYTKKPFTRIFLEYFIKERKTLNLLTRYFVSTTIQNYINATDYKLIPLKKSDNEIRIIFADIIEHLPMAKNEFDIELNDNAALIEKLCLDYMLWAADKAKCDEFIKDFSDVPDAPHQLSAEEQNKIDELQFSEYENKTADEFIIEEQKLLKEIEEYEQEIFEQNSNTYSMINKLFEYKYQKEGELNGNNTKKR